MNNIKRDYVFNLRENSIVIPKLKPSTSQSEIINNDSDKVKQCDKVIIGPTGDKGEPGPTGPTGSQGDKYCTKTTIKYVFEPKENIFIVFKVEPGLSYISGNSVVIVEEATTLDSEINSFEGIIQHYSLTSGEIILKDITNINGEFSTTPKYYYVNLNYIAGPTGPSNISENSSLLQLTDNTIIILEQNSFISYYKLLLHDKDELKKIYCHLTNNKTAIVLISLDECLVDNNEAFATIFPIINTNNNYNSNILINNTTPYVILKIQNIENIIFCECNSFYKNISC